MQPRIRQSTTTARPVAPPSPTAKRPLEKPVEFRLKMPQAHSVALAGTFNNWDPTRNPMRQDSHGTWKTTLWLPPGRYEYRFVADNQWLSDPNCRDSAPNAYGTSNSVATV